MMVFVYVFAVEHEHAMAKFSRTSKRRDSDKVWLLYIILSYNCFCKKMASAQNIFLHDKIF